MKDEQFYDKVARKFGDYSSKVFPVVEFNDANPEKLFKDALLELSPDVNIALDVGCADGRFTLSMAQYFKKIIGIDMSAGMLKAAEEKRKKSDVVNVEFLKENAEHTSFENEYFDLVFSRRGASFYKEFYRILKKGGSYLEIRVAEQDAKELKKVFGRGQNYETMNTATLPKMKKELEGAGFKINIAESYFFMECYSTAEDLDLFLQGVPIFKDFDSEKDKGKLEEYVEKYQTDKGIPLRRHRIVLVAQK